MSDKSTVQDMIEIMTRNGWRITEQRRMLAELSLRSLRDIYHQNMCMIKWRFVTRVSALILFIGICAY